MKPILNFIFILLFMSCTSSSLSDKEINDYSQKGKKIAQATLKKLGGNLMQQMKNGGVKQAIPFCNVAAIPLTKELSKKYDVSIKRTSHKLRNDNNKPSLAEENILKKYLIALENGETIKPIVLKDKTEKIHFYAPIKTQKKCLACHGNLSKNTDSIIKSRYPNDQAIGFKEGGLRGLMSITFN